MADNESIPELTETERARWQAAKAAVDGVMQGLAGGDAEGAAAAVNQLHQIDLDMQKVRDSVHVPADAGVYRERLEAMLRRIPDGWGRWVRCDAGWYRLICELDAALAALDPGYEVHQVKEKYGELRFYAHTENRAVTSEFVRLIREAEKASETTCENCGSDRGRRSRRGMLVKTLCLACCDELVDAAGQRFVPVPAAGA